MPDQGVTLNARIQYKKDTDVNWTSNNPVLLENELIIVEMENGDCRFKIGDGVRAYSDLPFADQLLRDKVDSKVSKEEGKALSSNDFTDDLKNKLDGISIMKGATADADGTSGLVPPPHKVPIPNFLEETGLGPHRLHQTKSQMQVTQTKFRGLACRGSLVHFLRLIIPMTRQT